MTTSCIPRSSAAVADGLIRVAPTQHNDRMTNQIILVTGCQRSGTTMLNLVLDSHPDVHGIDEMQFDVNRMRDYLNSPEFAPVVCLKLPAAAAALWFVESIRGIQVLWALRDPRAVVASMVRLPLALDGRTVPWAAHPAGALVEIDNAVEALNGVPADLAEDWQRHRVTVGTPPERWSPSELARSAALCWRLKNDLLRLYDKAGIAYRIVGYEDLVHEPEAQIRALLTYLKLNWHDDVLRHHLLHRGASVGQTDNTRAVDTNSIDKWREVLASEELAIVHAICGARAQELGYGL